jgi:hypothetical protein
MRTVETGFAKTDSFTKPTIFQSKSKNLFIPFPLILPFFQQCVMNFSNGSQIRIQCREEKQVVI